MKKLTIWIKQHQLISFFILSFAISWGLLITLGPLYMSGVVLVIPILMLALFGPALAGIILSGVIHPQPKQATHTRDGCFPIHTTSFLYLANCHI